LPQAVKWKHIFATGFLGGIGFTMSIFITLLAYDDIHIIDDSKMAILVASLIAGMIGFVSLKVTLRKIRP
jgi:NhaA family Na+:H+ antiporter